jgi:glycosyltransferase involved in cell wall biosynthesis
MIDIIIPTYNNLEGLKLTLNSIPKDDRYHITIIDDCSTQDIDYSDMIN